VGRDLSTAKAAASDIFARIENPIATDSVVLATRRGRIAGIRKDETADVMRVIDISSLPPVVHTVRKADISVAGPGNTPFDHATLSYTPQELRDAAAFLSVGK
jgi:hypothetical protein